MELVSGQLNHKKQPDKLRTNAIALQGTSLGKFRVSMHLY